MKIKQGYKLFVGFGGKPDWRLLSGNLFGREIKKEHPKWLVNILRISGLICLYKFQLVTLKHFLLCEITNCLYVFKLE
jgi:hypothetical protein